MEKLKRYKRVLSIAGSDPSGGAGLQADLKTVSALGCYGMTTVVAVVDENTVGVTGVHPIPVDFVSGQIHSCLDDIGADAVKIGMLHSAELILTVRDALIGYEISGGIVLDPVMVATSGDPLLQPEAVTTLKNELIPMARVITPNIPEAEILLQKKIERGSELKEAAFELSKSCDTSVLLKAGHLSDDLLIDIFYNAESGRCVELSSPRYVTVNTHGTGCSLSSAIAAFLAKGCSLDDAIANGKTFISEAIRRGAEYEIGHGHGPVHHFHAYW
ncbi:MAG: bifunctional hydroxymethylpyrimidine kinase/phosphomethylpyrimidine kinase [Muribaculaceae bacterium]|nr:bifunctional hydroxymethylpyrimidine kinase/phosphomethylpyrimidine kinase [Muribaculaceae bacterium]